MTTRHLPAFLGCVLLAGPGCSDSSGRGGAADQDNLRGTWRVERVEVGSKVSEDEDLRNLTLTFEGETVVTEVGGVRHEGTFTLDASRTPHHIDFKPAPGNTTDKKLHGLYAFESDNNLRLCFSQKSRPSGFHTSPVLDTITLEMRRTPPREPGIKVPAGDLVEQCARNKALAADAYRSKVIQVSGKVKENKDGHIFLTGENDGNYVECAFNRNYKSELERVTRIKDQQKVVLRGTFNGAFETRNRLGTFVQLLNCEVVEVAAEDKP
jgi:uncharacterized protein (TIGR03067 family)